MKRFYLAAALFLSCALAAQQVGMYNHYFLKPVVYNPALAGAGDEVDAMFISRSQWTGFNGAPELNIFSIDGALKQGKVGLGLTLISDTRGINRRKGGNVSYSYRFRISEEAHFLLGLSLGAINQGIDFSKAMAENFSDPTLYMTTQQKTVIDANAGLAFIWKGLELAASAPQLFANRVNYMDNDTIKTYYLHARHYLASLKYKFPLSEEKGLSLAPQFLMRVVPGTPIQFDGNLNLDWKNKLWLGGTYKSSYAIAVNAGVYIHQKLRIGYSYEIITSRVSQYAGISHEIMICYSFSGNSGRIKSKDEAASKEESKREAAQFDSLLNKLTENEDEIAGLNSRIDQQVKAQQQAQQQILDLQKKVEQMKQNAAGNTSVNNNPGNPGQFNNQANTEGNTVNNSMANNLGGNTQGGAQPSAGNQNANAVNQQMSKVMVNDIWLASNPASEHKNADNLNPKPGYYVIVGTFFYRDFAIAEMQRFRANGYQGSNWMYSEPRQFNYIYTNKMASKEEAIAKAKSLQSLGIKDAWVLELK